MSLFHATNSSMPNLVGLGLLLVGGLSALSLMVGGTAILDFKGDGIADFAFAVLAALVGFYVLREGTVVGAWLAAILFVGAMTYAELSVNSAQAMRMAESTINAAKEGASAAAQGVAGDNTSYMQYGSMSQPKWHAKRPLSLAENTECEAALPWTKTPAGIRNCTPATNGTRYVWEYR